MSSHAAVKVILRSKATIESPILLREEAEKAVEQIGAARVQGGQVALPWINVSGVDVEAVHLEARAAPRSGRAGSVTLA